MSTIMRQESPDGALAKLQLLSGYLQLGDDARLQGLAKVVGSGDSQALRKSLDSRVPVRWESEELRPLLAKRLPSLLGLAREVERAGGADGKLESVIRAVRKLADFHGVAAFEGFTREERLLVRATAVAMAPGVRLGPDDCESALRAELVSKLAKLTTARAFSGALDAAREEVRKRLG